MAGEKEPARDSRGRFKKRAKEEEKKKQEAVKAPAHPAWLKEPAKAAVTALITASGLVTFVAAVGGAIVWVRFYSAELPASQALAALPRGELIASGAVLLAAFMIVGALAALGVYLFDRDSLAEGGDNVMMALVGMVTVEAVVVVTVAIDSDWARRVVAAETVIVIALAAVQVLRHRTRPADREGGDPPTTEPARIRRVVQAAYAVCVAAAIVVGWRLLDEVQATQPPSGAGHDYRVAAVVIGSVLLAVALIAGVHWVARRFERPPTAKTTLDDPRLRIAIAAVTLLSIAFVVVPAAILWQRWIAVALAVAVLLAFVCLRVAREVEQYKVMWCAIAVFMSVPLLGAVAGIARNLEDPQVQPVAFIRKEDGVDEAVQGIYVTETDDRLYFANVATDGCSDNLESRSGRLLWVPRTDVVTMALGPPQSVEDAGQSALEMYYALAPRALAGSSPPEVAVAAAAAATAEGAGKTKAKAKPAAKATRRLEDIGPALRRDFDLQPQLTDPSTKSVVVDSEIGREVQLTQRAAAGAGARHTIRVGKVEAWSGAASPFVDGKGESKGNASFKVPEGATDGPVTIECGHPTTQPYLAVRQRPVARIAVGLRKNLRAVWLDGTGSTDRGTGAVKQWEWRSNNSPVAEGGKVGHTFSNAKAVHGISLRVADDDGDASVASLVTWRTQVDLRQGASVVEPDLPGALLGTMRRESAQLHLYVRAKASDRAMAALGAFREHVGAALKAETDREAVRLFRVPPAARCPRLGTAGSGQQSAVRGFVVGADEVKVELPQGCNVEEI